MASPSSFDWVTARSECSLFKVFQQMRLDVQADVNKRNGQRTVPYHYEFSIVNPSHGPSSFMVVVSGSGVPQKIVEFRLIKTGIAIHKDGSTGAAFEASITLNDDGECRLKVDGREYEFWQVRRKALEELLFNVVYDESE
jgi:hypothetical protein